MWLMCIAHMGRTLGLFPKRGTIRLRYAPNDDNFLKCLIFANVSKRMELHSFLALIWKKYGLVFGDKEAEQSSFKRRF
jgi:hypothetical protein